MKIVTKHYGKTIENNNKYLVYLIGDLGAALSCSDVIGEKAKLLAEKDLMDKFEDQIETVETVSLKDFIIENNLSLGQNGSPLVLVFYLDADLMKVPEIIEPFTQSINDTLAQKDANAIAFFLPTKGQERIECINPQTINEETQLRVDGLISDITTQFDIGTKEDDLVTTTTDEVE